MLTFFLVIVGIFLFYTYRKAKQFQKSIQMQAEADFLETKKLILRWAEHPDDQELTEYVLILAERHRRRLMNCQFLHLGKGSAETEEYLKRYSELLHEDEVSMQFGSPLDFRMDETMRFREAYQALLGMSIRINRA